MIPQELAADDARRRSMLDVNVRQQDYYESRFEAISSGRGAEERAANGATRTWTRMRRRLQRLRAAVGVDDDLIALHREWLGDLGSARVLDLGCFTGNRLSLWIAASSAEYVGVDLSQSATDELDRKLRAAEIPHARAVAMDFLANDWPDGYFDVVYAYSVLHHFADLDVALRELHRILRPGGIVITMDPLATDPINRLARVVYRPFQTDRDWEFPFTRGALRCFERHFHIESVQGLQGTVKLAYPLLAVPALETPARALASRLRVWDAQHGRSFGIPLYMCWHLAMKLRRR